MSGKSKHGTVLSRHENPETGELEFYEMTSEEAEEAINHIIQIFEQLPPPKPVKPKTVEREARRGARIARRFLAGNPTQEELQRTWECSWDETDMGCGCAPCLAFEEAYREVLRRHLT